MVYIIIGFSVWGLLNAINQVCSIAYDRLTAIPNLINGNVFPVPEDSWNLCKEPDNSKRTSYFLNGIHVSKKISGLQNNIDYQIWLNGSMIYEGWRASRLFNEVEKNYVHKHVTKALLGNQT